MMMNDDDAVVTVSVCYECFRHNLVIIRGLTDFPEQQTEPWSHVSVKR